MAYTSTMSQPGAHTPAFWAEKSLTTKQNNGNSRRHRYQRQIQMLVTDRNTSATISLRAAWRHYLSAHCLCRHHHACSSPPNEEKTPNKYSLVFYAPLYAVEESKAAIFASGAGRYPGKGDYTECCWTATGTGQFRPGDSASPHIGRVGEVELVDEARVEILCVGEDVVRRAVAALKRYSPFFLFSCSSHP